MRKMAEEIARVEHNGWELVLTWVYKDRYHIERYHQGGFISWETFIAKDDDNAKVVFNEKAMFFLAGR